jgi:hypothetical protein
MSHDFRQNPLAYSKKLKRTVFGHPKCGRCGCLAAPSGRRGDTVHYRIPPEEQWSTNEPDCVREG